MLASRINAFGPALDVKGLLVLMAYEEARVEGRKIYCRIIQINKFGSLHLSIRYNVWDAFGLKLGDIVTLTGKQLPPVRLPYGRVFSDVSPQSSLILKDDYDRVDFDDREQSRFDSRSEQVISIYHNMADDTIS